MKKYLKADLEIVEFDVEDVITTSGDDEEGDAVVPPHHPRVRRVEFRQRSDPLR